MNLKNFKLLKEDDTSYRVGHPNGKSIVVNKKGLSDSAHEAIKKLKTQHLDEGGFSLPDNNVATDALTGDPVPSALAMNEPLQPPEMPPVPASPAPAPLAAPPIENLKGDLSVDTALQNEKADILRGAEAENQEGLQNAKMLEGVNATRDLEEQSRIKDFADNQKKSQSLFEAYQSTKLDPNRYFHDKSTGSKILAGIGLALSGMGSASAGQSNFALDTINKAIERDIDAQKNDQSKAFNLYKMNREMTEDANQAHILTENQLLVGVKAKMLQASAVAQGPLAKARIAPQIAQIDQQVAENNRRLSLIRSAQSGQADPTLLATAIEPNPEKQKELIKQVGVAQKQAKGHQIIDQMADKIDSLQTVGNYLTHPIESRKQVAGAESVLTSAILEASPSKRLNPEVVTKQIEPLLANFFNGKATREDLKNDLHALLNSSADETSLLKSYSPYGLKVVGQHGPATVEDFSPSQKKILAEAKTRLASNPSDEYAIAALRKLGVR